MNGKNRRHASPFSVIISIRPTAPQRTSGCGHRERSTTNATSGVSAKTDPCRSPIIHPRKLLCCSTFIAVMKTAELWNCDNLSHLQHLSGERTLLVEAQVGSRFVVVAEVRRQRPLEMASVQDDVVVQRLPSNRADESLGVWILPGTLRCRQNLLDAQRLDSQSNFSTVPAVAIADEITGSFSVCECLHDLLRGPSPGRMLRHIKVQHLATIMFE